MILGPSQTIITRHQISEKSNGSTFYLDEQIRSPNFIGKGSYENTLEKEKSQLIGKFV